MSAREEKTVLITGTTSGVGEGLMRAYLSRGDRVVVVNRHAPSSVDSERLMDCRADVRNAGDIDGVFEMLKARGIRPDIYILNAGIHRIDNSGSFDDRAFGEVLETNLMGVLRFVSRGMALGPRQKRTFVAMSSTAAIFPNPSATGYYISKLGLNASFEILRKRYQDEWNDFKIVLLGPVRTRMLSSSPLGSRLQTFIRDSISLSVDQAVSRLVRFIDGRKGVLRYTLLSHGLFHLARIATAFVPGIYKGTVPATR